MIKLKLKWVSEAIGEEYKEWKKGDIIKILAQTGTGKTFFIKSKLVPYMKPWERMLIAANRINLKRQLKKDLLEYYNQEIPKTLKELDNLTTIGNVTILSYQQISELKKADKYELNKLDLGYYSYIICDECQFFFSDASFNNKCHLAWQGLVQAWHRDTIKIFISATMDEVEETIDMAVDAIQDAGVGEEVKCSLFKYSTNIDYSYLNIKYFRNIKDIATLIKNDISNDKWLVFVTKKDDAKYMKEHIEKKKKVSIITKDTDINKSIDLQTIITESKYECDVLICTKAMDNGINIADDLVKNVVIMAWDKISFIQELGRIRIDINNASTINLYIPTMSWSSFNTLLKKQYECKEKLIEFYQENRIKFNAKYDYEYEKLPRDIFILDKDEGWKINIIGHIRLVNDRRFATEMCDKFGEKENTEANIFAYIKEQLNWIEQGHTFNKLNLIQDVIDDEEVETLKKYLEKHVNEKLFKEQQQELCNLIIKELTTFGNNADYRTKILKPNTLENILRIQLRLPYAVSKSKQENKGEMRNKRYIVITKIKN
ncbi:DEAD/DEAH box helicase [Clostridium sp.]|uniref:DEAD/DEAH box helicase n=1 Tax=Clostridium sp. TaxID=1506 RepID=UPI00284B3202|nr:DEAD/DEAH box helicase [Clostridium sp.]MDR3594143.1 DEAD/DEAH box helicase [Clostridium sp.]